MEQLTEHLLSDLEDGVGESEARPGIIGEIGTSEELLDCERIILRAAARAGNATSTTVNVHCDPPELDVVLEIIDILTGEGLDSSRIHISFLYEIRDLEYHQRVLELDVVIVFDSFGQEAYYTLSWKSSSDLDKMTTAARLIDAGYADQILVGQDVCRKTQLRRFGGMGYGHVIARVVLRMQQLFGIRDLVVEAMLIETPRRLLTRPGDG